MAKLTIGLSDSGVVNGSKTYTLNDAMVTRIITAMRVRLELPESSTNAQVLAGWADDLVAYTKRQVFEQERRAAADGVTPIEIT